MILPSRLGEGSRSHTSETGRAARPIRTSCRRNAPQWRHMATMQPHSHPPCHWSRLAAFTSAAIFHTLEVGHNAFKR